MPEIIVTKHGIIVAKILQVTSDNVRNIYK